MRAWLVGITLAALASSTLAQSGKSGSGPNTDPKMEELLRGWETKSRNVRDVECEFRRITKDKLFKTEELEYGKASGIKPYQGRLDLLDENGKFTQIFIFSGRRLHQYDFKNKQEIIHVLPEMDAAAGQSLPGPLGFVYGMKASEAKSRFDMKLIRQFSKDGVDYAEIVATPKTQADQQDFKSAQLVLDKQTYLPRELRVIEPNGNEQHWIFDRLETNLNPPVSAKDLAPFDRSKYKELAGWKQVVNNLSEPSNTGDAPKTKPTTSPKTQAPEAARKTPAKR